MATAGIRLSPHPAPLVVSALLIDVVVYAAIIQALGTWLAATGRETVETNLIINLTWIGTINLDSFNLPSGPPDLSTIVAG